MTAGTQYVFDGAAWQAANTPPPTPPPDVQDFTSSGTWTKPAGARRIWVELIGAGGTAYHDGTNYLTGAGGEYFGIIVDAASLGATESVTVGAGQSTANQTGGTTSFAGFTAEGGIKQVYSNSSMAGGGTGANGIQGARTSGSAGASGRITTSSASATGLNGRLGAGSGAVAAGIGGIGGTDASVGLALKAGNGGNGSTAAQAPGGGGGIAANRDVTASAPGGARITTYF